MKASLYSSPFYLGDQSVRQVMMRVQLATTPAILTHAWFFGFGIFVQLAIGVTTALIAEALMLYLRNKPLRPYLSDWSVILATTDLILCLPSTSPWWLTVSATLFAVVIAKHLFGGLGYNLFNPAMAGYAFALISFPAVITVWHLPNALVANPLDAWQTLNYIFIGTLPADTTPDALTGATPLAAVKAGILNGQGLSEIQAKEAIFQSGQLGMSWTWINVAFLVGGLWLLYQRVISWQLPVGFLVTLTVLASISHGIDPERFASATFHLFSGATMLAAFFIITDPVTGSTTPRGRLLFGIGAGVLVFVIRTWGVYPDGVAFAVLLMNLLVPWLDAITIPRVYGHRKGL